jgi:hypothetical protein
VTNRETRASDAVSRRVVIAKGDGTDTDPDQGADPGLRARGAVVACQSRAGFTSASVKPAGRGLRFRGATRGNARFTATVFQTSTARSATRLRRVAAFGVRGSRTWNGRARGRRLARGIYSVRLTTRGRGPRPDVRGFAVRYTGSRFVALKPFQRSDSCGLLSYLRLASPAFGGSRPLVLDLATRRSATVTVTLSRGGRTRRASTRTSPNRLARVTFRAAGLPRGRYRVTVRVRAGSRRASGALYAAKL